MERAEKSTQSAHARAAAAPSASNAAPIADHRPAAVAQRALAGWVAQREPIQRAAPEEDLQMKIDPAQLAAEEDPKADENAMLAEIFNDPDLPAEDRRLFESLYNGETDPRVRMQAQVRLQMFREYSWPRIKSEREEMRRRKEEEAAPE